MNCTDLNKEYECSALMVKALMQFLSATERKKVYEWLHKLSTVGDEVPEAKVRNEYIGYLLVNVQNGRLLSPFNLVPSYRKLRPLSRVLPEHIYEDAMKQLKMNICFMKGAPCTEEPSVKAKPLTSEPANFVNELPRPRKGIIAHCSAFSNYEE